jgi:hypothetical protein
VVNKYQVPDARLTLRYFRERSSALSASFRGVGSNSQQLKLFSRFLKIGIGERVRLPVEKVKQK